MPLLIPIALSYLQGWWVTLFLPLIKIIPWWVWVAIGLTIAFLVYGQVQHHRGYAECQVQVKEASDLEAARQIKETNAALVAAKARAQESDQKAQEASNELDQLQKQVAQLKTANQICLPGTITKQYRNR